MHALKTRAYREKNEKEVSPADARRKDKGFYVECFVEEMSEPKISIESQTRSNFQANRKIVK